MKRSLDLLFSFLLLLVGTISIITTATISSTNTNIKMILVMLTALSFILTGLLLGKYMFTPDELDDTTSTTNTATNANTVNNDDSSLIAPVPNTTDASTTTDANNASTNDAAVSNDVNSANITRISTADSVISNDSGSSDDDTAGTVSNDKTTAIKPNSILSSIIHSRFTTD